MIYKESSCTDSCPVPGCLGANVDLGAGLNFQSVLMAFPRPTHVAVEMILQ